MVDSAGAAAVAPQAAWSCPICAGARPHTRRQRCPLEPPPPAAGDAFSARTAAADRSQPSVLGEVGRWTGAVLGTCIFLIAFVAVSAFTVRLTLAEQSVPEALGVIAGAGMAGGTVGLGLMFISMRVYAKVVLAALSVFLVSAGFLMISVAPALRQMNTPELAEYRAFAAMLWFGVIALILGVALGVLCIRWALRRRARRRLARWARLLGSGYGVLLGISGVIGIIALFSLINGEARVTEDGDVVSVVEQAVAFTAIAMWSFAPGLILTYHGISASMGESSSEYRPPVAAWLIAAFAAVLLIGGVNMRASDPFAAPMPVLHVLAAALPPLALAAMAARGGVLRGRGVRQLTWKQVTLAAAISMGLATTIAAYVESLGAFGAVVLLLVHNGAFALVRDTDGFFDVVRISDVTLSENEQFFANLITAALLAPLIEEFAKSLGPRFMFRPMTTRAQAFVLGAVAGGAFGFLEGMLYGLAGIGEDLADWWQIMLLRGGSTSGHVFDTGLAALAWWYWSIGRRTRPAVLLAAGAVASHALWNGSFTVLESRIFGLETLSERTLETAAYGVVAVVSACYVLATMLIARGLREPEPRAEGTPLAALAPWLG